MRFLIEGIYSGFRTCFNRKAVLTSSSSNMHSATLHPKVITEYLQKEISLGCMLGPFALIFAVPRLQINHFGVIPKGHNTRKWRLITDLSFSPGRSVNEGIDPDFCSLTYTTVDQVAETVSSLGRAALMVKVVRSSVGAKDLQCHSRCLSLAPPAARDHSHSALSGRFCHHYPTRVPRRPGAPGYPPACRKHPWYPDCQP